MAIKKKDQWAKRWKVTSFTDSSQVYTVSQHNDGHYGCSCKAWIFQRKRMPNGHCKHIEVILAKLAAAAEKVLVEATRKLLDEWAVQELEYIPDTGMWDMSERVV